MGVSGMFSQSLVANDANHLEGALVLQLIIQVNNFLTVYFENNKNY